MKYIVSYRGQRSDRTTTRQRVDQSQLPIVGSRLGSHTVISVGVFDNHVRVGWQDETGQMFAIEGRIS